MILFYPTPGQQAQFLNEDARMIFENLLSAMQECKVDFSKIGRIDFTDLLSISFDYENRIRVVLGEPEDLSYKITFSRNILTNEDGNGLDTSAIGLLDLSRASNTDRGIFTPYQSFDEIDTVPEAVQPIEPEPAEEPSSEDPDASSEPENGEDGEDGENGEDGEDGENGEDGEDGEVGEENEPEDDGGDETGGDETDYEE